NASAMCAPTSRGSTSTTSRRTSHMQRARAPPSSKRSMRIRARRSTSPTTSKATAGRSLRLVRRCAEAPSTLSARDSAPVGVGGYIESDGHHLAYQVREGAGPREVVLFTPGGTIPMDYLDRDRNGA